MISVIETNTQAAEIVTGLGPRVFDPKAAEIKEFCSSSDSSSRGHLACRNEPETATGSTDFCCS